MDREIRKLNDTLVNIFNTVMKMEEEAIQKASYDDISITEVHTLEARKGQDHDPCGQYPRNKGQYADDSRRQTGEKRICQAFS